MKIKISLIIDSDELKHFKDTLGPGLQVEEIKACTVPGCTDGYYAKGYCQKHYKKWKNYGDPLHVPVTKDKGCLTEGCTGLHYAKGYCYNCYMSFRNPVVNTRKEKKEWKRIQTICSDSSHGLYPRYGGRGVVVCDRWRDSFDEFYNDMGEQPHDGDIIDCSGDVFESGSCRWMSFKEFQEDSIKRASERMNR